MTKLVKRNDHSGLAKHYGRRPVRVGRHTSYRASSSWLYVSTLLEADETIRLPWHGAVKQLSV